MTLENQIEIDANNNSAVALMNSTGNNVLKTFDTHDGTKNTMIYME